MQAQDNVPKYVPPQYFDFPARRWPSKVLTTTPLWCSVDLRDGNQALPNPLGPAQKLEYFRMLCAIGFKQIEISFPSASRDDFDFTRRLIEEDHVPADTRIMVLTQCREAQIERTIESLRGVRRAIFHAYCATSPLHREHVFGLSRDEVLRMAVDSVRDIRARVEAMPDSDILLEFSPEEFSDTEPEYALEVCTAVVEAWGHASPERPVILNLPATVERRPPNQYADLIEWFQTRIPRRDSVLISLHPHNDQGMSTAAAELGLLAGADRVEGTLFGHGERTGNVDLVTLACNQTSRGIVTGLDFSRLPEIVAAVERLTGMPVPLRQPYAGEYSFTAFSGSHQDAIRKGLRRVKESAARFGARWRVPYLHIDPRDLGREYRSLIRINTQSGKGGAVWVLETEFGLEPPRAMHAEIGREVQRFSDRTAREVSAQEIYAVFEEQFMRPKGPYELVGFWPRPDDKDPTLIHGELHIKVNDALRQVKADGNGPLSALVQALAEIGVNGFQLDNYHEQAVGAGADARAVAYVPLRFSDGQVCFGVGSDTNIDQAAVRAVIAALNRHAVG